MKVLSIGNSFSQDAQHYLHRLAKANNVNMKCVNLYIGGCELRQHYYNCLEDIKSYLFELNGENTGIKVSVKEALMSDNWDIVTVQQASHNSFKWNTYEPYLKKIIDYIKLYSPESKIYIHETWAYESGSQKLFDTGFESDEDMFSAIKDCYDRARNMILPDGFIPAGKAMFNLSKIQKVHRDTFHATFGVGRYLLSKIWFQALTKTFAEKNLVEFDCEVTEQEISLVDKICKEIFC